MIQIRRACDQRLTVAEVKQLLLASILIPKVASIRATMSKDGNYTDIQYGEGDKKVAEIIHRQTIEEGIPMLFKQLGITPRNVLDPSVTNYRTDLVDIFDEPVPPPDGSYTISHSEFVRIAELYRCEVVVEEPDGATSDVSLPKPSQKVRGDGMTPLIKKAQSIAKDPVDASEVFNILKGWAQQDEPPVPLLGGYEKDGKGILWENSVGDTQALNREAVARRIKRMLHTPTAKQVNKR